MPKIDVFAHVLLPCFYGRMLQIEPSIPERYAFFNNEVLQNIDARRATWDGETRQVVSYANALPEDYVGPSEAVELCRAANDELAEAVRANRDLFEDGVGMVPMNDIDAALSILRDQIAVTSELVGAQIFTRALGKSIASDEFLPLFHEAARLDMPLWLHPVFDVRKPDNNLVFSWEYELTQAMLQLVQAGVFERDPKLKIIVHHAGGMAPFFAGRIDRILPASQAADFRRFYADTAILGNTPALELAADYFGIDHLLFGTDAPLGVMPAGATAEVRAAIDAMRITGAERDRIYYANYLRLVGKA